MKPHSTLHLLFNHTLTDTQQNDAYESLGIDSIVYMPQALLDIWRDIPPHAESLKELLTPIYEYIKRHCQVGDYLLVQGDAGASYLVVGYAFSCNLQPIYATTKRTSIEQTQNGKSIKTSIFEHVRFRLYESH